MTNFLSKIFLFGIVLSSVSGYCQSDKIMEVQAGYVTGSGADAVTTAPAAIEINNNDTTFTNDITVGTIPTGTTYDTGKPAYISTATGKTLTMGTYTTTDPSDGSTQITNGTTLTINNYGQIKDEATIVLAAQSKMVLEPGATVASSGKEANISGGTLDLSKYITNTSNAPVFDSTNAATIFANLNKESDDNIINVDLLSTYIPSNTTATDTKTLLDSFNSATVSTMFSGIKGTFSLVDTPYVINHTVNSTTTPTERKISDINVGNIATNTTLSFSSIKPDNIRGLFDTSGSTISGKNAQDAFNALYDTLNKDNAALGSGETSKKIIIDIDSFETYLSSASNTINTANRTGTDATQKINIVLKRAEQSISLTNETEYTIDTNTAIADKYVLNDFAGTTTKVTLKSIPTTSTIEINTGNANTELDIDSCSAPITLSAAETNIKTINLTNSSVSTIKSTESNATLVLTSAPTIDSTSKLIVSGIKLQF